MVVKRKIPSPRRESNPRTPIVLPVAQRYTDRAITTLIIIIIILIIIIIITYSRTLCLYVITLVIGGSFPGSEVGRA
jgi:hypothetical protein